MSVTMGNAIRQLKLEISASDIDMPEQDVRYDSLFDQSLYLIQYNTLGPISSISTIGSTYIGQRRTLSQN